MADRAGATVLALQLSCRGNAMRERILRDLVSFAESRGELQLLQTLPKTPKNASIDWLRLYEEVVARGGYQHVSQHKLWPQIIAKECMDIDILPYVLALYYERYLYAFEEKQLFGRDLPPSTAPPLTVAPKRTYASDDDHIASASELQEAQNMAGTSLPHPSKRLKMQRSHQHNPDLGTMHGIVLALDSNIPDQVLQAINLLSVLSYGNPNDPESELLVDTVPGLLDAIYRQLQQCALLPHQLWQNDIDDTPTQRARRRLLNAGEDIGQRELLDARGLLLLNIVRNLSMVPENQKLLADHEEICVFLILVLRSIDGRHFEIGDHALDILCNISKRIDFFSLHPPAKLELWHPHHQLSSHLWKKEKLLPLECVLQQLTRMLLQPQLKRSVLLRTCELFCNACRDVSLRQALASSKTLQDPALLNRVVGLLACSRQDFSHAGTRKKQVGGVQIYEDDDMEDDDEDEGEDHDDENSRWPAPWESDGYPSGVGMGVVYVSPEGNRNLGSNSNFDDASKIDHEIRDAALEVLFRLSDVGDAAKTFAYFLPIEKELILVACSDRSVSDILNNVVADVYGMHSL
ncbi:Nedd4 e3 ubiquitin-protein ligase wwp2, partial [Globisporangium splendens]